MTDAKNIAATPSAPSRRSRRHAAAGARIFVTGLAVSATITTAALIAGPRTSATAQPVAAPAPAAVIPPPVVFQYVYRQVLVAGPAPASAPAAATAPKTASAPQPAPVAKPKAPAAVAAAPAAAPAQAKSSGS